MPRRFLLAWSLLFLGFAVHVNGCTALGYGVGSAIDGSLPPKLTPGQAAEVVLVKPGATVVIHYADSSRVAGRYRGLDPSADSAYAARYSAWRATDPLSFRLPRIGATIRLASRDAFTRSTSGTFLGFGPRALLLAEPRRKPVTIPFEAVASIQSDSGEVIRGAQLLDVAGRVPVQTIALLESDGVVRPVDLQDEAIRGIEIGIPGHGYRTGLSMVGLLADASLVLALAFNGDAGCAANTTPSGYSMRTRVDPDTVWLLPAAPEALAAAD